MPGNQRGTSPRSTLSTATPLRHGDLWTRCEPLAYGFTVPSAGCRTFSTIILSAEMFGRRPRRRMQDSSHRLSPELGKNFITIFNVRIMSEKKRRALRRSSPTSSRPEKHNYFSLSVIIPLAKNRVKHTRGDNSRRGQPRHKGGVSASLRESHRFADFVPIAPKF